MAINKLDPHYSDFGGLDTRSNKLNQNPKSARVGTKNNRFNYEDQLQKREGFQHKTEVGDACEAGLIEYKYKDINTGESRTEILGVSYDGFLRKKITHFLKLTRTTSSLVCYYSFYYDDVAATHKLKILDTNLAELGSINVSLTMTLATLVSSINSLALTGFTASVVDEDDAAVVASTLKAYLMDVVWQVQFATTVTDNVLNGVFTWELVETPDGNAPFVNAIALQDDPDYEGISYANAYNSVYITDGGFPFKYDGKAVYRAGMPKTPESEYSDLGYNGFLMSFVAAPGFNTGIHNFRIGIKYKDRNGVQVVGKVQPFTRSYYAAGGQSYGNFQLNASGANCSLGIEVKEIKNEDQFPVYSCRLNGAQSVGTASGTYVLNVGAGHNVKVGQALRMDHTPIVTAYWVVSSTTQVLYAEVTAVTATTITINLAQNIDTVLSFKDNQILNSCYVPEILFSKSGDLANQSFSGFDWYGAYYVIYATKSDVTVDGTYYEVGAFPIPAEPTQAYSVQCECLDAGMLVPLTDEGEDLPRACRYLGKWQEQLIQAGRPYSSQDLAEQYYPTIYSPPHTNGVFGTQSTADFNFDRYTEAHLCDFQSIYWADAANLEGFPQSGLNEESFETEFNDRVTGIGANKNALFALKENTTGYLTGTLATGDLVKEFLESAVGNACQGTVQDVGGTLMYMDENGGFYSVVAGRLPEFLGYPIQDFFKKNKIKLASQKLNFKKAKSANFKEQDQYICYVPAGNETDPTSYSLMFVYDYSETQDGRIRGCWYVWQGVNAAGGILATADGELLISQKQASNNRLWKQKFSGSKYDFSDHTSAIEFNYKGAFLSLGAPVIDKNWIMCVINSVLGGFDLRVDQYANFMDDLIGSMDISFSSENRTSVKQEVKAKNEKLSSISWGFYNNEIHQDVRIDGWEVQYSASFDLGEAKK